MTVHIGQLTSEVTAAPPRPDTEDESGTSVWAEQERLAALLRREQRDRLRTATGVGHD